MLVTGAYSAWFGFIALCIPPRAHTKLSISRYFPEEMRRWHHTESIVVEKVRRYWDTRLPKFKVTAGGLDQVTFQCPSQPSLWFCVPEGGVTVISTQQQLSVEGIARWKWKTLERASPGRWLNPHPWRCLKDRCGAEGHGLPPDLVELGNGWIWWSERSFPKTFSKPWSCVCWGGASVSCFFWHLSLLWKDSALTLHVQCRGVLFSSACLYNTSCPLSVQHPQCRGVRTLTRIKTRETILATCWDCA